MNTKELRAELVLGYGMRESRAAFGSIIRRHVTEFAVMDRGERIDWLRDMDMPLSYDIEIAKEVSVWRYNNKR